MSCDAVNTGLLVSTLLAYVDWHRARNIDCHITKDYTADLWINSFFT